MKHGTKLAGGARAVACCALMGMLLGGCAENDMLIRVKPDGSGQIVVSRVFMPQAVAAYDKQMAMMKKAMASRSADVAEMEEMGIAGMSDPFFNEKALKKEADRYGSGVTFVKASRYDNGGARGSVAVYSFKDINQVFFTLDEESGRQIMQQMQARFSPGGQDDEEGSEPAERSSQSFGFKMEKGAVGRLRILAPPFFSNSVPASAESVPGEEDEGDDAEEMAMMQYASYAGLGMDAMSARMMMGGAGYGQQQFEGARFNVAVEVVGSVLKSNASHPDREKKGRFTLLDVSADKMLASPEFKKRGTNPFQMMNGMESGEDFLAQLRQLSWVTIETNSAVTIEFK